MMIDDESGLGFKASKACAERVACELLVVAEMTDEDVPLLAEFAAAVMPRYGRRFLIAKVGRHGVDKK